MTRFETIYHFMLTVPNQLPGVITTYEETRADIRAIVDNEFDIAVCQCQSWSDEYNRCILDWATKYSAMPMPDDRRPLIEHIIAVTTARLLIGRTGS